MDEDRYLISRREIEAMPGAKQGHFLNPDVARERCSLGHLTGLTGIGFHIVTIPPGKETTAFHAHHFEDECVYILEGSGMADIGATSARISAGDFLGYRKGGEAHKIRNTGAEPLRCIVVGERRAHDVIDYPRAARRLFRNGALEEVVIDPALMAPVPTDQA